MGIQVSCDRCGAILKAKDEHAGKRIRCPKCKETVSVPKINTNDDDLMFDELLDGERTGRELDDDEFPVPPISRTRKPAPKRKSRSGSVSGKKVAALSGGLGGAGVVVFIVVRVVLVVLRTQGVFVGELPRFFNSVIAVQRKAATEFNKVTEAMKQTVEQDSPNMAIADQALQQCASARQQFETELNGISIPSKAKNADELVAAVRNFIQTEHDVINTMLPQIGAILQDRTGTQGSRMRRIIVLAIAAKKREDVMNLRMIAAQRAFFTGNNIPISAKVEQDLQQMQRAVAEQLPDPSTIPDGPGMGGMPRMPFGPMMGGAPGSPSGSPPTNPGGPPMGPGSGGPMGPGAGRGPMGPGMGGPPGGTPGGPPGGVPNGPRGGPPGGIPNGPPMGPPGGMRGPGGPGTPRGPGRF
jgi:hypothetical protein